MVSLTTLSLAGCGGGGSDDDSPGLAGTWRVAEIGTASGTAPCPREIELGNGVSTSCGSQDTLELRKDGGFRAVTGDPQGGAPATLTGTWSSDANESTVTIRVTQNSQDENGDGQIDEDEVLNFDPPLVLLGVVRERTDQRAVVDLTFPSPFGGQTLSYRVVLTRR